MSNPYDQHMDAVNHILAYLRSSTRKYILFSKHRHLDIMGYIDIDFIGLKVDRKSYLIILYFNL